MDEVKGNKSCSEEMEEMELRRGPWTVEEDLTLINYIANHGEGRWNSVAHFAGLKRTGKSCRLRWLNYLRPDVRRGNISLEEQLLILELHSRWGNRWSKIAQHLPGRTDNEIKNYWRTRVQKHAKQLKCDVNSKQFKDAMRYLWMPRLVERIQAASASASASSCLSTSSCVSTTQHMHHQQQHLNNNNNSSSDVDSFGAPVPDYYIPANHNPNPDYNYFQTPTFNPETLVTPSSGCYGMDQSNMGHWIDGENDIWNVDQDFLLLDQPFNYTNTL